MDQTVVVEGLVASDRDETDLSSLRDVMTLALDQRAFGPRRLLVAFADSDGRLRGIAHARRTEPIEVALRCCLEYMGRGAAAAVAFNDERVGNGPPPDDLADRFWVWRAMAAARGVHLVDWIACDDQLFRLTRSALGLLSGDDWWDVP